MAFKFVFLACALALANASYNHGPMNPHYGPSTAQYASQELRYPTNTVSSTQGASSQSENIIRGHSNGGQSQLGSNQHKTVQISSGSYSLSNQGKNDVRVTNPGTYSTNSYTVSPADGNHEQQQVTYASTPSYSNGNGNGNGYEHSISSSAYQQSTPVYGHSNNGGTVYAHHTVPVYQYVTSGYGLPTGSSYAHHGNSAYSQSAGSSYAQNGNSAYSQAAGSSYGHNGNAAYSQAAGSGNSGAGILGVSYSPAVAVSHMSYSSPVGISYAW